MLVKAGLEALGLYGRSPVPSANGVRVELVGDGGGLGQLDALLAALELGEDMQLLDVMMEKDKIKCGADDIDRATYVVVHLLRVDHLCRPEPLLHPVERRQAVRDPGLQRERRRALCVEYGGLKGVRDVRLHDGDSLLRGELDRGEWLATRATGALDVDAVEDTDVLVLEQGDGELVHVEREKGDLGVVEELGLEDFTTEVRVLALPLRVELYDEDPGAHRDGEAAQRAALGVDGGEPDETGNWAVLEELGEELLCQCGLGDLVLDADGRVDIVDEVLVDRPNFGLRRHVA